jgi:hypothetical protein
LKASARFCKRWKRSATWVASGGALSGPIGIGLGPITDDHADAGMGL